MFLETDADEDSQCKWIWTKKGDIWYCDWYWDTALERWEAYGLQLKDVYGRHTDQSPVEAFDGTGKFTKIDEDDLFAILL